MVCLLCLFFLPTARAEHRPLSSVIADDLSGLQSVSLLEMDGGLHLLAFKKWPPGKDPQSQLVVYRKTERGIQVVYEQKYDGAYCAKLDLVYDFRRDLAPILVLFVNYGAACQKAVVHRFRYGVPYRVQELEGGAFSWIPGRYPYLELLCLGSAATDPEDRYRWNGSRFDQFIELPPNPTPEPASAPLNGTLLIPAPRMASPSVKSQ